MKQVDGSSYHFDLPNRLLALQRQLLDLRRAGKLILQSGDEGAGSAPSNIALLKYWGKLEGRRQIPVNSSLSFTIGGFRSFTTAIVKGRFLPFDLWDPGVVAPLENSFSFGENVSFQPADKKLDFFLKSVLAGWANDISLSVHSMNNFPSACGIASSASGYAALAGALADLFQLEKHFTKDDLNYWLAEWSRLGSGSATRSTQLLSDAHFVAWELEDGNNEEHPSTKTFPVGCADSFRHLRHSVIVVDAKPKEISSSEGHRFAASSAFQTIRLASVEQEFRDLVSALGNGDFLTMARIAEADALLMHAVMQTSEMPARYLGTRTANLIAEFVRMRDEAGAQAFWTLDAGPNLHLLYLPDEATISMLNAYWERVESNSFDKLTLISNASYEGLVLGKEGVAAQRSNKTLLRHSFN